MMAHITGEAPGDAVEAGAEVRRDQRRPRPWVVVVAVAATILGTAAVALIVFLIVSSGTGITGSRPLAYTDDTGRETVRLDLGAGGEAVPFLSSPGSFPDPDASFVSADGVEVKVKVLTLYNESWDDEEQLDGLVRDYRSEELADCDPATPAPPGGGDAPLPTGTASTGMHVRVTLGCASSGARDGRTDELYAFVAEPHRLNADNVARDWILVHASGVEAESVRRALERAVATVELAPGGTESAGGALPLPPDPGSGRNDASTVLWSDEEALTFPAGWSLVGAGYFDFAAPASAGIDAVCNYASPGIAGAIEFGKPGDGPEAASEIMDRLVENYANEPLDHGCTERTDFEPPRAAAAEIRWTGCPNGLVDRILVYPGDGGGIVLLSVRAADDGVATELVHELAGIG